MIKSLKLLAFSDIGEYYSHNLFRYNLIFKYNDIHALGSLMSVKKKMHKRFFEALHQSLDRHVSVKFKSQMQEAGWLSLYYGTYGNYICGQLELKSLGDRFVRLVALQAEGMLKQQLDEFL